MSAFVHYAGKSTRVVLSREVYSEYRYNTTGLQPVNQ